MLLVRWCGAVGDLFGGLDVGLLVADCLLEVIPGARGTVYGLGCMMPMWNPSSLLSASCSQLLGCCHLLRCLHPARERCPRETVHFAGKQEIRD